MWKELFDLFRQLLTLARDTDRNKTEIENLREEFDDLTKVVQALGMNCAGLATTTRMSERSWPCAWRTRCSGLNAACPEASRRVKAIERLFAETTRSFVMAK